MLKQKLDSLQPKYVAALERSKLINEENKHKLILYTEALERIHQMAEINQQLKFKHTEALDHAKENATAAQFAKQQLQNQVGLVQNQYAKTLEQHNQIVAASQ